MLSEILKELESAIKIHRPKILAEFQIMFPLKTVEYLVLDIHYDRFPNERVINEEDNDFYCLRINSEEKFWEDWEKYKRILKIKAFL